jgi:hypothetical protein
MFKVLLLAVVASNITCFANAQSAADTIKLNMKKLQSFAGTWQAKTIFHLRDGTTAKETGKYKISWTLDSCYLQWDIALQNDDSKKQRHMLILMTFNTDSARYDVNYFYAGWSMRVLEAGILNNDNEFLTTAFIPLEDGVHDEYVKTVTRFTTPGNMHYVNFSRFNHEKTERKDFEASLTRLPD